MLLQFSCSNFRSIKDKITFSMLSSRDVPQDKHVVSFNDMDIERITAIYGANGSGKSNFVSAIDFARHIVINSMNFQPGQTLQTFPHKLMNEAVPCVFSFQFVFNNIRYAYSFSISHGVINEEYLYYFPNNRKIKIFTRKGMSITAGSRYQNTFELSLNALQDNRLFLPCAANFSRAEEIKNAFMFFDRMLVIYKTEVDEPRSNNWYEYSVKIMQNNPAVKAKFLQIMKFFDTGITDIRPEMKRYSTDDLAKIIPELLKAPVSSFTPDIERNGWLTIKTAVKYDKFEEV